MAGALVKPGDSIPIASKKLSLASSIIKSPVSPLALKPEKDVIILLFGKDLTDFSALVKTKSKSLA